MDRSPGKPVFTEGTRPEEEAFGHFKMARSHLIEAMNWLPAGSPEELRGPLQQSSSNPQRMHGTSCGTRSSGSARILLPQRSWLDFGASERSRRPQESFRKI